MLYIRVHIINPCRACSARVTVVAVSVCLSVCSSVCLSVKSHLTYGASVHHKHAGTYSVGNKGQKNCSIFSETIPLHRSSGPSLDGHT